MVLKVQYYSIMKNYPSELLYLYWFLHFFVAFLVVYMLCTSLLYIASDSMFLCIDFVHVTNCFYDYDFTAIKLKLLTYDLQWN